MKSNYFFVLVLTLVLFTGNTHAQVQQTEQHTTDASELNLNQHTLIMLEKHYTAVEIQEMKELAPEKLKFLDYYYSASFKLKEGQNYTNEQVLLIDVIVYQDIRKATETVDVLDEASGLILILDSIETAAQQVGAPNHIKNTAATGKIAY